VKAVEVVPSGPVRATLRAPASKSITNRLLVIAALAEGCSLLRQPLDSDDTRAMRDAAVALGASVEDTLEGWRVSGTRGWLRTPVEAIDARLSGTTLRFATAMAALAGGRVTITGAPPLLCRPIGPLVAALQTLGANVRDKDGLPPVWVERGGLKGGEVEVDVSRSSQFASAVLLVAPYSVQGVTMRVAGTGAMEYVDLTCQLMRRWGAAVIGHAGSWGIAPDQPYRARDETVEYDASAAAHLFALAAATGGEMTVVNAIAGTRQPDAGVPTVLEQMGCAVTRHGDALTVTGPPRLRPVDIDLQTMPDQITTLACLAALAEGTSLIRGVAVTRGHETDRLAALAHELRKLGVAVTELPDGLVITGGVRGSADGPVRLSTYDDHRLAMAFAAIGARAGGVVVEEPWCVTKTYPDFWHDLSQAGVSWRNA
jgi:3-phosphoshikimate 1-carboxyvinyltransferase